MTASRCAVGLLTWNGERDAVDCARSLIVKVPIALHQVSDQPAYDIYVLRSYAEFLWLWLEDAAREYGLAVAEG